MEPSTTGAWIDFGASALNGLAGYASQVAANNATKANVDSTNKTNRAIAEDTNALNSMINERNISFQQEQNAINRLREDNAIRRRANDLVGAGLSKTLAAGSPASANAMQAPSADIPMVTGAPMQAAKAEAFKPNVVSNFELAGYHRKQMEVAEKELEYKRDVLEENIRHNKVSEEHENDVLEENRQYHELQDEWKKAELDQNSRFHDDAVRLQQAELDLKELQYLSDAAQKEFQNAYYSAQTELAKVNSDAVTKKLTAELAESAARTASYMANVALSDAQIKEIDAIIPYYAEMVATLICEQEHYNASTKAIIQDTLSKTWNLAIAQREDTTTTSSVPGTSTKMENQAQRSTSTKNVVLGGLVAGATTALGYLGSRFIMYKFMDHNEPWKIIKN